MLTAQKNLKQAGFTLIELLVALTIVTILAVAVFAALNPAQRLKDAKDARRSADVDSILTSIHEYIVDNKGALPTGLSTSMIEKQLGIAVTGCTLTSTSTPVCNVAGTADCVDLTTPLAKYLKTIPIDPVGSAGSADSNHTHYSVKVDANNIVTVNACNTDAATTISASR